MGALSKVRRTADPAPATPVGFEPYDSEFGGGAYSALAVMGTDLLAARAAASPAANDVPEVPQLHTTIRDDRQRDLPVVSPPYDVCEDP